MGKTLRDRQACAYGYLIGAIGKALELLFTVFVGMHHFQMIPEDFNESNVICLNGQSVGINH